MSRFPWPRGSATGVGSLPGSDPREAVRTVLGELPTLPHLPELPARGPGAGMIGRAATLLVDLPVQIEPSGWRFAARPGVDLRRARDLLSRDLDALEEIAHATTGAVKIQVAGPVTLAASIELVNGQMAVADPGAVREIAASLAAGLGAHIADVSARLPDATVVVQLDEPSVSAVIAAEIPTPSGYGTLRAVPAETVSQHLEIVLSVIPAGRRIVHCCAGDPPIALFRGAGADAVSIDLDQLASPGLDALGTGIDGGMSAWLGVVPSENGPVVEAAAVAERVRRLWDRLAFDPALIAEQAVLTPACGLGYGSVERARQTMAVIRAAADRLNES